MRACFFLLIAGLLDAVLTHMGVAFGLIEEGNPLVKFLMEKSWTLFYLIKVSLPIVLIGIMFFRPLQGWIKKLLTASCVVYFSILMIHCSWIAIYLHSSI